jgi:hypothetical protein
MAEFRNIFLYNFYKLNFFVFYKFQKIDEAIFIIEKNGNTGILMINKPLYSYYQS